MSGILCDHDLLTYRLAYNASRYFCNSFEWNNDQTDQPDNQWTSAECNNLNMFVQVVQMLLFVVVSFALCWLPFQVSILYSELRTSRQLPVGDLKDL